MAYSYYVFHKPFGCVTARKDARYPTVMDYFVDLQNEKLSPVGRLDRETEGLLLVTDDGAWNHELTYPTFRKEKTYEFTVLGDLDEEKRRNLESGILLRDDPIPTAPAQITVTGKSTLGQVLPTLHPEVQRAIGRNRPEHPVTFGTITITEGRNRQIRRMMKAVHCCVIALKRISMDGYSLPEDLQPGQWMELVAPKERRV